MTSLLIAFALSFAAPQDPTIPAGARQIQQVEGRGVQVYHCAAQAWTPRGPDAKLYSTSDPAAPVTGTHTAGPTGSPTWIWIDGSAVRGKPAQKLASPDPGSVPWLLLSAEPASGAKGILSGVVWVRRSNTHGGAAPAEACDAAKDTEPLRVPYTATYTFYTAP